MTTNFRVLDASRAVVDEVNALIDRAPRRMLDEEQLRSAAGSITANLREAYGRNPGPDRNQFFRYARGSAEESDERLRSNYAARRLQPSTYWRLHNRLLVVIRMLTRLMR